MLYWYLTSKIHFANIFFAKGLDDPEVKELCNQGGFLDFPRWYKYLNIVTPEVDGAQVCSPQVNGLSDIWLIVLAIVEIMLRIAVLVAIAFVVVGGIKFIVARGNADKLNNARNAVQDALFGLIIAVVAIAVVSFIAGRFSAS